jgi:hypothetical protein
VWCRLPPYFRLCSVLPHFKMPWKKPTRSGEVVHARVHGKCVYYSETSILCTYILHFSNFMHIIHSSHPEAHKINVKFWPISRFFKLICFLNRHFIFRVSRLGIYLPSCLEYYASANSKHQHCLTHADACLSKAGIQLPTKYLNLICTSSTNWWYTFLCS